MEVQVEDTSIQESNSNTKYKTPSYMRRAVDKYHEKNKERLNEYAKNRWREKYENDPEFREKHKQRSLERYHRKKAEQEATGVTTTQQSESLSEARDVHKVQL